MLGDVCAIVMGGHHRPLSSLAVLIVTILVIEQSLFVAASQINQTAAAYQVNINSVCVTDLDGQSRLLFTSHF